MESSKEKRYIHIYTGNGKGKSTAAIGQAVRAAGAGLKTLIIQFMKEYPYSEKISLEKLSDSITLFQVGKDDFVFKKELPPPEEIQKGQEAINKVYEHYEKKDYDLIILDEVCVAIYFGIFKNEVILNLLKAKPNSIELILTGRYCPQELIEIADLVTEMKEVKHYYQTGVLSRRGIDS